MEHLFTLVRLNVFHPTLRAAVIAATIPNVCPLFAIFGAAIIIHELSFRHFVLLVRGTNAALSCNAVSMI
jgi:hypothetical protein